MLRISFVLLLCQIGTSAWGGTLEISDVQVTLITKLRVPVREAAVVNQVLVKVGDVVEEGETLAKLDDTLIAVQREASLVEAQLAELDVRDDVDLRYAQKSEAVSRAEYARMEEANRVYPKSISETEMAQTQLVAERSLLAAEQAERDIRAKQMTVELRYKEVEVLTKRMEMMQVTAPTSGVIVDVYPQEGEWAPAGSPVVRLIRLDRLRVEAFVDGRRYDQSLVGAPVRLTVNLPPGDTSSSFEGFVTFVSPEINPVTNEVKIQAEIANPDSRLRPGSRGKLAILLE